MNETLAPLFASLTHGVYVIGVAAEGRENAFTAAWVMQASFQPPMLALSVNPLHSSYAILKAGGGFTVNVLKRGQQDIALHFGLPQSASKLATVAWHPSRSGAPILKEAMAWFECELDEECTSGDHLLVVGRVIDGGLLDAAAIPMDYRDMSASESAKNLQPKSLKP